LSRFSFRLGHAAALLGFGCTIQAFPSSFDYAESNSPAPLAIPRSSDNHALSVQKTNVSANRSGATYPPSSQDAALQRIQAKLDRGLKRTVNARPEWVSIKVAAALSALSTSHIRRAVLASELEASN
jgi:hypothetical protein